MISMSWEKKTYLAGATSRMQYPNVPNVTEELRRDDWLVKVTFNMPISWTTGELIVVMRRRIAAANSKKVPTWWNIPVLAILRLVWFACERWKVLVECYCGESQYKRGLQSELAVVVKDLEREDLLLGG